MNTVNAVTLDRSTRASNPGSLSVKPLVWLQHYPVWPLAWLAGVVAMLVLALLGHWIFWIPAALLLGMNALYWRRVQVHFRYGAVNPGVVVSVNPMRIAFMSDLGKGDGRSFPIVKVIEKELPEHDGKRWVPGTALAAVALYKRHVDDDFPRWKDFDPRPVACATDDRDAIAAVQRSVTEQEWKDLSAAVKELPRPIERGSYLLFPDG